MPSTTHHTFETQWDAPFDAVRIAYAFTPGYPATGPSFNDPGEPGEPDSVEPILCRGKVGGVWRDEADHILQAMAKLLEDDLVDFARAEIEDARAEMRAAAREAA